MPVIGLGGFFFRAQDPEGLKAWYGEVLGVGDGFGADESGQASPWFWHPEPGPVVFEPFKATTDYFASDKSCMLNFRVRDLDSLLEQLNARGIEIITASTMVENRASARVLEKNGFTLVARAVDEDWGYPAPAPADKWIR